MTHFTWSLRSLGRSGSVYTRIERLLLDMTTVLCRLCQTSSLSDAAVSLFSPIAKQQRLPDRITDLLDVEMGSQRAGGREISSDRCRGYGGSTSGERTATARLPRDQCRVRTPLLPLSHSDVTDMREIYGMWRMRKQWIPGSFSPRAAKSLGTRLGIYQMYLMNSIYLSHELD